MSQVAGEDNKGPVPEPTPRTSTVELDDAFDQLYTTSSIPRAMVLPIGERRPNAWRIALAKRAKRRVNRPGFSGGSIA